MSNDKIRYKDGYKYQLAEDYSIYTGIFPSCDVDLPLLKMRRNGELTIKEGYAWDGASGIAIDTKAFMRGSLVHDALYQLIRDGSIGMMQRKACDALLAEICAEDGMGVIRATYVRMAVNAFGEAYATAQKEILEAP